MDSYLQAISFADFFLADILTSMSKVYALSLHDDGPLLSYKREEMRIHEYEISSVVPLKSLFKRMVTIQTTGSITHLILFRPFACIFGESDASERENHHSTTRILMHVLARQKLFVVKVLIVISLSGAFRFGAFSLSDGEPPGQCRILEVSL